jgi:peptidoglycan/xylan/chitin deacetylase (PgdA/CDA1 family)
VCHRFLMPALVAVALAMTVVPSACGRKSTALPPNLVDDAGTQIAAFDTAKDWSVSGGRATVDRSRQREGLGSVILRTGTGGKAVAERPISQHISGEGSVRVWIRFPLDWNATVKSVNLRFSPDRDFRTSLSYYLSDLTGMHEGWNLVSVSTEDFAGSGGASWSARMIRLRVELVADTGRVAQASFDDLRGGVAARPAVVMSFDDGDASVYSTAYPIMRARGLRGTAYIVSSSVGASGKMTLTQLRVLDAAGWDIGNHSSTHRDLATLDLASIEKELDDCAGFLTMNDLPRSARDVAYPFGGYDQTVLRAMEATGMTTGRTVSYRPESLPVDEPYLISASGANATQQTVAQIESSIDRAVHDGATIHLFFHGVASQADSYYQSIPDFTAICDYVSKLGLPSLTISEYRALSSDQAPRSRRSHALSVRAFLGPPSGAGRFLRSL